MYTLISSTPPLTFQPNTYDDIAKIKCVSPLKHNDYMQKPKSSHNSNFLRLVTKVSGKLLSAAETEKKGIELNKY